ncbi:MAG: MlaD family protein [Pseudomonadota bacterium]
MSKHASPTLIGIFVAGAIGLIVAGILIISGGKLLLTDKTNYVLHFKGSVKGLNIGSPVRFRGVNIGTVTDIQLVVDEEESDIRIPVIIEIDNTKFIRSQTGKSRKMDDDSMTELVEAGMRAQLQLQSLLTGQLFIQIDFFPNTQVNLVENNKRRRAYQEIPTIPTPIEIIGKLLEDLPMDKIKDYILSSIAGIDRLVNSEDLQQSISAMRAALEDFRHLVANLDRQVEPVATNVNLTLNEARDALQKADTTLDGIRGTLEQANITLNSADVMFSDEQILTALDNALHEITSAAYAIRTLAETINNQPESLIRGRR